jgi:hypothetical protein
MIAALLMNGQTIDKKIQDISQVKLGQGVIAQGKGFLHPTFFDWQGCT